MWRFGLLPAAVCMSKPEEEATANAYASVLCTGTFFNCARVCFAMRDRGHVHEGSSSAPNLRHSILWVDETNRPVSSIVLLKLLASVSSAMQHTRPQCLIHGQRRHCTNMHLHTCTTNITPNQALMHARTHTHTYMQLHMCAYVYIHTHRI